jgi:hypothetical protein
MTSRIESFGPTRLPVALRSTEHHRTKRGGRKDYAAEIRISEVYTQKSSTAQNCSIQIRVAQIRACQVRFREIRATEIRSNKCGPL